jgi:cytochrome c peroxidase
VLALAILSGLCAVSSTSIADVAREAGLLRPGAELGEEAFERPREVFRSEARGGRKSYLVAFGDAAFNSPLLLGGAAKQAGISCNTCHINGANNPRLFIPGLSGPSGTFDTSGHVFNAKADNGVLDPASIPSLRGAHLLSPYGHDGHAVSLADFVEDVIVNEFDGPQPAPETLRAIVAYIDDIDFVPNARVGTGGRLQGHVSEAESRGEALFYRPFAHNPELSCAVCHVPSAAFVDHRQHDVGSGGNFKTPTLLNANHNAPYFHDGRYVNYSQVVAHFDRVFYLGLSSGERQDLVAYLQALGDGEQAMTPDGIDLHVAEITDFLGVLDTAIADHNPAAATLTLDALDRELRELTEKFPERKDTSLTDGVVERSRARSVLKELVISLHQVGIALSGGNFTRAGELAGNALPLLHAADPILKAAEPWSLFNRQVHAAHYAALRAIRKAAIDPSNVTRQRVDLD